MKTIIAGSREITDLSTIEKAIKESKFEITSVVSGGCRGVDRTGESWASNHRISCEVISANWDLLGKAAGYIRNEEMAQKAEALVAIWDGTSTGTRNMISIAKRHGLKVHVFMVKEDNSVDELPLFRESEKKE